MKRLEAKFEPVIKNISNEANHLARLYNKKLLDMPDPWKIEDIKPILVFYKKNFQSLEADLNSNAKEFASNLLQKGYLDSNRLVLITHGFHNNFDTDWLHQYKDLILNASAINKYDHTVAILGWGNGSDILVFRYRQAASNVIPVGNWLGAFTKAIYDLQPKLSIYGIGHSLGAHVMGIAGRTSKVFTRITGLDPAGPCFEKVPNSPTLYKGDAQFVDVIHTDGYDSKLDPMEWFFPVNHYGSLIPIGTFDFYPNYGYHQPGAGTFTVAGSHLRSLELFAWSISNPGKFMTSIVLGETPDFDQPVEKTRDGGFTVEMGYHADVSHLPPSNASTLFYIKTNAHIPWV
ncbi:hypothetical protein RDWZM_003693 [Blomia tropicalis]|uniref:Lipase domain-containing protein n=1 Tax=Blomia tropicalis TaxID=40697 RepID=A0A9Q0MHE3_BLOTA|nr:hypothetical protein RDWZM_003693 [Blomia tropicalis]